MNVWAVIKHAIERETGYQVIALPDHDATIDVGQIVLSIHRIQRIGLQRSYAVYGELSVKASHEHSWQVVTDLLDLQLTGTAAEAYLTVYGQGFTAMSIAFQLQLHDDEDRVFKIQEVTYGT